MTNRDPKTGRFIKKKRTIRIRMPNEFKKIPGAVLKAEDYNFQPFNQTPYETTNINLLGPNNLTTEDITKLQEFWDKGTWYCNKHCTQTKTPTNYWNYILVGVLGMVMLVIGYELHELLPIP